jgi:ATP-dependent Clp protease ATP-binding subunit ClpA
MTITLLQAAHGEARRLGHNWVGPEHALLAVLRDNPEEGARLALEEAGMDAEMVERHLDEMATKRGDGAGAGGAELDQGAIAPNPSWYRVSGRAEGFAACLGTGQPRPVDLVLALLWDERHWLWADQAGVQRESVISSLARLGARLPSVAPPPLDRREFTQKVEFPREHLDAVLAVLAERHPPGAGPSYGYNHDGDSVAWVVAEDGIDLQAVVDEASASMETS